MDYHYLKKQLLFIVFFSFALVNVSAQVPTYYNGTNITNTGQQLKTNLALLIQQGTTGSYTPGVWNVLKQTDLDPNNANNVLLIYGYNDTDGDSKTDRTRSKNNNGGNSGTDWNREHTYPKSLGSPNLGTSGPGSDIHHLRSSDVSMNSNRGSRPFIDVVGGGNARAFNNGWYPGDEWKGDVARMMMYMYLRYENRCKLTKVGTGATTFNAEIPDIFLEWNVQDPVSQYEINRNVIVEGIQGNRNPFIDNPAFATAIWGGPQAEDRFNNTNPDNEAPSVPTNLVASVVDSTSITLSWDASTDNIGVIAYQIFQDGIQIAAVATTNYNVSGLAANTTYSFSVKAIDASSNTSLSSNTVTATTLPGVITPPNTGDYIVFQGFEANDSWGYTASPVTCNDNGNDVWDVVTSVGSITTPKTATSFFGVRDLDGNCGTSTGGSLSFDAIDVSNFEDVQLSFSVNVVGYDVANGDTIGYQVVLDGQMQAEEMITVGSSYTTTGWETINVAIPNTVTSVSFVVNVKQNGGSDYAGFDDVSLSGTAISTTPTIIINELDADTSGADTQEFVELYDGGQGNTSLDGLVLVFYNGSNNLSYRTIDLSGQTTNATGYFVIGNQDVPNVNLVIPNNGLQNGADAVALYSGTLADFPNGSLVTIDNLIDAVVYDTNDGDDAELLILLNSGEPQLNEDELGEKDTHSLQRGPNGVGGARNTSSYTQSLPTPGAENGVVIVVPPPVDTGDFIAFQGFEGDDSWNYTVSPVVCNDGGNDVWDVVASVGSISTAKTNANFFGVRDLDGNCGTSAGGSLSFETIDVTGFENVQLSFSLNVVGYDVANGDTIGYQIVFDGQTQSEEIITVGSPFSTTGWEAINIAVPDTVNTVGFVVNVKQNGGSDYAGFDDVSLSGTAISSTSTVLINELDADTSGTDTQEFVELFDGGIGNTSLDGLVLVFYNGSNNSSYRTIDLSGQTTNATGYFVIGNQDVPNVNLVVPNNALQNGADAVALYQGSVTDFPNSTSVTTTNLVDAVVYGTNDADDAELLILLNTGEPQLNEDAQGTKNIHSLQRSPNGLGGARNTSSFTQLLPTPGAKNADVVTAPTSPSTIAEARNKVDGEKVFITGVLTVADEFRGSAYIQDTTGAIAIFDEQVYGENIFKIGDSITVKGTRSSFKDQIQISQVTEVINNGVPNNPIEAKVVTLNELVNYPSQLVKVLNPTFPKAGDILFGNSNYNLTDASGSGQVRIDLDVTDIVGLGQPETCNEIVGVVSRFLNFYSLLPRQGSDMSCATTYVPPTFPVNDIPKENTLDVVTWNIEWFGDEENSPAAGNPNSDQIQKESVKAALNKLDADVIAVQEIVDVQLFDELLKELPAYDYVLSDAISRPNSTDGISQKVGFIYRKATVNVKKTEALLRSIHPLYNGGDDAVLADFPNSDKTRFYASGRLPFLMTADVTINGETEEYSFVALHARANNSGDAQNRYNMRKYDVEVLKDSLDTRFSNANLILLGDYNDDVDETVVADLVTDATSTYDVYIKDTVNYSIVTESLTNNGFRSFVFRENMIDHIAISNELDDNYLTNSERVHYEFYNNTYSRTTSDHFPVSIRLQLKELALNIAVANVNCNGANDGSAIVSAVNGVLPYTYVWSSGSETTTATGLAAGDYTVTVTDAVGASITQDFIIEEPVEMEVSVSEDATVYKGYRKQACTSLEVLSISGGAAPYSYEWDNGETTERINVCPKENTIYSVTITDANGCSISKEITVEVINVSCGNYFGFKKVKICFRGRVKCIPEFLVKHFLRKGAVLGSCDGGAVNTPAITRMRLYPNPLYRNALTISVDANDDSIVEISIYSIYGGRKVFSTNESVVKGNNTFKYNLNNLRRGIYYVKTFINGKRQRVKVLVKH
ncbi:endonuclease [Tenacibaculum ovolyticum]|uniref:endonuclease n=1 Tax=Tenacibaculum ovolyticum TaxID=104270 RepID=UPI0004099DC4|nr:endonuclease [Tenacibaculum ovolyticum]